MMETTVPVNIPVHLLQFGIDLNEIQRRVREWLVLSLFTEGHISSGKAARFLNLNRIDFLDLLRIRGIAYINHTAEEMAEEFAAVGAIEVNLTK